MPSDAIALKAVVDPILISESKIVIQKDTITAFNGISHPGRTCEVTCQLRCGIRNEMEITCARK